MSQRNIIYTIRFTEKEWKRLEQKIRENDEWKFKYGTKEGRVNIAAYIRDVLFRKEMAEWEQEAFYLQFGTPKPENLLESDRGKIESDTIYILSNKALDNGAVLIVQPEIIEKVGDLLQQNYYLFPSSRHEMLV